MARPALPTMALLLAACASGAAPRPPADPPPAAARAPADLMSDPAEYAIDHVSEGAGEAIFARTGVGDPYRTGIAYPVFLALLAANPGELGSSPSAFAARFGFTPRPATAGSEDRDDRERLPLGMHLTTDPNTRVPFLVTSCALCHADVVRWPGGERVVVGLGNKRIRIHAYDEALARIASRSDFTEARLAPIAEGAAREHGVAWPPETRHAILAATIGALRERAVARRGFLDRVRDGLPGRMATIEAFAVALGHDLGREVKTSRTVGWAKIPDVIGIAHRRTLTWDGAGEGSLDALVVDADIAAGARVAWLWQHPMQGPSLSAFLRQLPRDLRFPGRIDPGLAQRGKSSFERACSGCHGTYGDDGRATHYVERVVPADFVGTDPARAEAVTDDFIAAANDPRIVGNAPLVRTRRTSGYIPPVLTTLWARAPYGHAGQWPTLAAMAEPPEARPARFVVHAGASLDLDRVGVATGAPTDPLGEGDYLLDGAAPGLGASGHPFLSNLGHDEARAVIEYLKTL